MSIARLTRVWVVAGALLGGALWASCATTSTRWEPYQGCTKAQCKTWADECVAECINKHTGSIEECNARCGGKVEACEASCGG
jgi:hypothetical protein